MAAEQAYRGIVVRRPAARPEAAVLMLHGGGEHGMRRPSRLNGPSWRMRPFVRALDRAAGSRALLIAEARYRHRGWNGERADAARDAEAAVAELAERTGGVPTVLVGHSMGGRAALRAAGAKTVAGVVALAPWCPPGEPVGQLAGRNLVFVHAAGDRITSPRESLAMAGRARAAGALVCRYELAGGDHAMLREASVWHSLTADSVGALLGFTPLPAETAAAFALPPASTEGLALPVHGSALRAART
ncbi:alpha/beta fold hydrolase [Actinacidiphila rubida]|nr:alpha/beta fold hydrolase [Actinacidiphila rubida]